MHQKGLAPVLIVLILAGLTLLVGGGYYLGTRQAETFQERLSRQNPVISPSINDETVYTESDRSANWKTYADERYSFQYPADWLLESIDYLNTKTVMNKSETVAVSFSDNQYPFGFGNPETKFESKKIVLKVTEKEYKVEETVINGKSVFVNFKTDLPRVVYILFGTGYPALSGGSGSKDDYENEKQTIMKILSTFKFQ